MLLSFFVWLLLLIYLFTLYCLAAIIVFHDYPTSKLSMSLPAPSLVLYLITFSAIIPPLTPDPQPSKHRNSIVVVLYKIADCVLDVFDVNA